MNKRWLNLLAVFTLGVFVPGMLLFAVSGSRGNDKQQTVPTTVESATSTDEAYMDNTCEKVLCITLLQEDGSVCTVPLEDYITGVVMAEMPASFETEALKAQAVVARTYTLRRLNGNAKHEQASVCVDPACCQGYCNEEQYLHEMGEKADIQKIRQAVLATEGQVLFYGGELIEATYFSCSGGTTEDAAAVWGQDIPYLQATESPGEEDAAHYADTVYFTTAEFEQLLGVKLNSNPAVWFGAISYTDGQGVDTIHIGNKEYKGTEIRQLLGLRSTAFSITAIGDTVVITTKGYGHRVGMSQYGADAMAVQGSSYTEILAHYYKGTELKVY